MCVMTVMDIWSIFKWIYRNWDDNFGMLLRIFFVSHVNERTCAQMSFNKKEIIISVRIEVIVSKWDKIIHISNENIHIVAL